MSGRQEIAQRAEDYRDNFGPRDALDLLERAGGMAGVVIGANMQRRQVIAAEVYALDHQPFWAIRRRRHIRATYAMVRAEIDRRRDLCVAVYRAHGGGA